MLLLLLILLVSACDPGATQQTSPPRPTMAGITVDSIDRLDEVVAAIDQFSADLTVRLVFDPQMGPDYYAEAVDRLSRHAHLMGLLLDSSGVQEVSVAEVRQRARAFLAAFSSKIDIWEIGNELNGRWVGADPQEIDAKVLAAFEVVSQYGGSTALTLNYWSSPDCYTEPWEQSLTFSQQLPMTVRTGVDYVLLSVYETSCTPPQQPSAEDLATELTTLGKVFPQASLGIGETGAASVQDGFTAEPSLAERQAIAERYLGMHPELARRVGERFVGGYFWWYFCQDAVPHDQPGNLWPTLDRLLAGIR